MKNDFQIFFKISNLLVPACPIYSANVPCCSGKAETIIFRTIIRTGTVINEYCIFIVSQPLI